MTITDVNDNAPVFHGKPYKNTVLEGLASYNLTVATLSTTDKDEGLNASITYKITSGNENVNFTLDAKTVSRLLPLPENLKLSKSQSRI